MMDTLGPAGGDRIPEYSAHGATNPGCGFVTSALLDLAKRFEDFGCLDLGNWPFAKFLVREVEQPTFLFERGRGVTLRLKLDHQFIGDGLEGVAP